MIRSIEWDEVRWGVSVLHMGQVERRGSMLLQSTSGEEKESGASPTDNA